MITIRLTINPDIWLSVARYKETRAHADKKRQAAKRQEAASRQADSLSRKHLAGMRVRRQNLVYVTGLRLNTSDPQLSDKLRGDQYFGQYGKIDKIVVNRPKDSRALQPVGVYITYFDKEAAASCISTVNNSQNTGSTIRYAQIGNHRQYVLMHCRADYGTTKYCSAFLRGEICTNKNCTFLHEAGDESESFTREGLSSLNANQGESESASPIQTAQPVVQQQQPPQPHHFPAISESMERTENKEDLTNTFESADGSALPSTSAWGRPVSLSRRDSQARTSASASPMVASPAPASRSQATQEVEIEEQPSFPEHLAPIPMEEEHGSEIDIKAIMKKYAAGHLHYEMDISLVLSDAEMQLAKLTPMLFEPNGGASRLLAEKRDQENRRLQKDHEVASQALSALTIADAPEAGSLQLGGEPEERQELDASRRNNIAVQPPNDMMSPTFSLAHALSPESQAPGLSGRSSGPQQHFLPQQFKAPSPGFAAQGVHQGTYAQNSLYGGGGHARQNSRFSFANDSANSTSTVKAASNPKFSSSQASMLHASGYGNSGSQYFSSGIQGPPPGLKATGTPPVSGGGMFGQGHGFATAGLGYGVNTSGRNANDEMMRELLRNRGGSAGSGQTSEGGRREFIFSSPSNQSHHLPPTQNPGLSSFQYGSHPGAFQDNGLQKQKKKGKKHRHANTSSSGGGVVDLADPSILQARLHQGNAGAGQGLFSGQNQGGYNQSNMVYGGGYGRW